MKIVEKMLEDYDESPAHLILFLSLYARNLSIFMLDAMF